MEIRSGTMRHHVTGVEVIVRIWHRLLLNLCPVFRTWNISSAWCTFSGLSITFLAIHTCNVGISLKGNSKYRRSFNISLIHENKSKPLNRDDQEVRLHELCYGSHFITLKQNVTNVEQTIVTIALPLWRILFALFLFKTNLTKYNICFFRDQIVLDILNYS